MTFSKYVFVQTVFMILQRELIVQKQSTVPNFMILQKNNNSKNSVPYNSSIL